MRYETCRYCRYFKPLTSVIGRCHRYPPLILNPFCDVDHNIARPDMWENPFVHVDHFCGEYKTKER